MEVILTSAAIKALVKLGDGTLAGAPRGAIDELMTRGYVEAMQKRPGAFVLTQAGNNALRSLGVAPPGQKAEMKKGKIVG